jgi:hypothetical protein
MSYLDTNSTILDEGDRVKQTLNYKSIHVVEDFEEAEQFRYTETNETVEVGTPVGFDSDVFDGSAQFILFDGIYYDPDGSIT